MYTVYFVEFSITGVFCVVLDNRTICVLK